VLPSSGAQQSLVQLAGGQARQLGLAAFTICTAIDYWLRPATPTA
jgi:hypothetical protein